MHSVGNVIHKCYSLYQLHITLWLTLPKTTTNPLSPSYVISEFSEHLVRLQAGEVASLFYVRTVSTVKRVHNSEEQTHWKIWAQMGEIWKLHLNK
jgi:hypothetical protein